MPLSRGCPSKSRIDEYDLVFTDYVGITFLKRELGPNFSQYRYSVYHCKLNLYSF